MKQRQAKDGRRLMRSDSYRESRPRVVIVDDYRLACVLNMVKGRLKQPRIRDGFVAKANDDFLATP